MKIMHYPVSKPFIFLLLSILIPMLLLSPVIVRDSMSAGRLNINSADADQLTTLPGIGAARADAIIRYRLKNGPFRTVESLSDVPGIGNKIMEKIRSLVTVEKQ